MDVKEGFRSWAIVEVMGHTVYAGMASEQSIGGASFLRVDVPAVGDRAAFTKFLGAGSIFCITPCDEATARATCKIRDMQPFDYYTVDATARALAAEMAGKGLPAPDAVSRPAIPVVVVDTYEPIDAEWEDDEQPAAVSDVPEMAVPAALPSDEEMPF